MSTLYIDRQGSGLQVESGVLHIKTSDGKADRRVPLDVEDLKRAGRELLQRRRK